MRKPPAACQSAAKRRAKSSRSSAGPRLAGAGRRSREKRHWASKRGRRPGGAPRWAPLQQLGGAAPAGAALALGVGGLVALPESAQLVLALRAAFGRGGREVLGRAEGHLQERGDRRISPRTIRDSAWRSVARSAAPPAGARRDRGGSGGGGSPADAGSQHHLPGKRQQIETETGRSVEARCDSGAELRGACRLGVHGRAEARSRARMRVLHAQTGALERGIPWHTDGTGDGTPCLASAESSDNEIGLARR